MHTVDMMLLMVRKYLAWLTGDRYMRQNGIQGLWHSLMQYSFHFQLHLLRIAFKNPVASSLWPSATVNFTLMSVVGTTFPPTHLSA